MKLTVANDFQNNLDQATINSIVSHLADTLSGIEYLLKGKKGKNNTAYSRKIQSKSSKALKMFGTLSCIMTIINIKTQ